MCAKIADTITVRGAFVRELRDGVQTGRLLLIPHAFPYRQFCIDYVPPAESESTRRLGRVKWSGGPPADYILPKGVQRDTMLSTEGKYMEITGTITVPSLGPGQFIDMPEITVSKIVNIDTEVRSEINAWLAACHKWQDEHIAEFSKRLPGSEVVRTPEDSVKKVTLLWTPVVPQRCTLSATPFSKTVFPPSTPVVLEGPE